MGKEIERKYLVDRENFESWFNENFEKVYSCQFLSQSYLAKEPVEVRLRMIQDVKPLPYCYQRSILGSGTGELTLKTGNGLVRSEIGAELDYEFSELMIFAECAGNKIDKYRFRFNSIVLSEWMEKCCQFMGYGVPINILPTFEVDLYMDHLSFLATAEIEFCGADAEEAAKSFEWKHKPDWILREVTGDKTFSNANLAEYTELSKGNLLEYVQYLVGSSS